LIENLVDAHMRWTLGSELTSIPIERNMHEMIALGVGFLDKMATQKFDPDVNYPVYLSEPLVVLSLSSLFEKQHWTSKKAWMARLFRNALNTPSLGYMLEPALLLVLMDIFGRKSSPLADAFHCSQSLGLRSVNLVSLKRIGGGEMERSRVSWNAGSSDRLGFKAELPNKVLKFLDNPDGKVFLFPDNCMGPDLLAFVEDVETKELLLLLVQSKLAPQVTDKTWQTALNSVTPNLFYTVVVDIINPGQQQPSF
jgi:hypothetical protein